MSTEQKTKVVLITGASRGIGKGIAEQFAQQDCQVIGTATSEAGAQSITDNLASAKLPGKGIVLKLEEYETFKDTLKVTTEEFGVIDILVNNAAVVDDNLFMRMKASQWERVIQINLNAAYHLMKACIRPMVKQRCGRVINISSVVAVSGNLGQANYCAAKAGLIGMSKAVALEVARYGVTVNCIAPGFIQTDMTAAIEEKTHQAILDSIPMGKMGNVEDIAAATHYLASDGAQYVTGSVLHINGGLLMP